MTTQERIVEGSKMLKQKSTAVCSDEKRTWKTCAYSIVERAQTIANYLESKHWEHHLKPGTPHAAPILLLNSGADESVFALEKLNAALKSTKDNKQPGPDGLQVELLAWLNRGDRQFLLSLINSCWRCKEAPTEHFLARVVSLFKRGDSDNAANYRPISLSLYIYMIVKECKILLTMLYPIHSTDFGLKDQHPMPHISFADSKTTPSQKVPD